jgi:hypothetical protein
MAKILTKEAVDRLVSGNTGRFAPDTVGGSVARAGDIAHLKTLQQLRDGLGLDDSASIAKAAKDRAQAIAAGKEPKPGDGSWSAIPEGATEAYQLRWRAGRDSADTTFIPFGGPTGEDFGYMQGLLHDVPPFDKSPLVEQDRPFTGTGSTSGGIPEWIARGSNTGSDPQIWKLDRDGNAEIYAQYDPQGKSWKRTK